MNKDTFKQYIPIELVKGKDKNGKNIVKFRGIASTGSEDADGEYLDPTGFDTSYFLSKGVLNWNHQSKKSPKASFVGRPTGARITKGGDWEVDGEIFADLPMGREIIELQEGLAEYGMSLGMSIEGQAVQRDPNNPKRVLKANITGLAITPTPKNSETTMELIKGMNLDSLESGDCEGSCGDDICSCGLEKSLSAYENSSKEEIDKAMSVGSESGKALAKESLDDEVKVTNDRKRLSKGDALEKLLVSLPKQSSNRALEIYNILDKLEKGMSDQNTNTEGIDLDVIEKALAYLTEDSSDTIEKSLTDEEITSKRDALQAGLDELNKACDSKELTKGDDEDDSDKKDDDEDEDSDEKKMEKGEMKKSLNNELGKSTSNDLVKGMITEVVSEQLSGLSDNLVKAVMAEVSDKFAAVGRLEKGILDQVRESNELLNKIANAPNTPKSVTGIGALEKGVNDEIGGLKNLGRENTIGMLTKGLDATDWADQKLANELTVYESSGEAGAYMKNVLAKEGYTI